jgi:outer membrane protein OmpA-like peptidoglycan-associated protein
MKNVSAWTLAGVLAAAVAPMHGALAQAAPSAAAAASAPTTRLHSASQRITDRAIQADQQAYEALQGRIKGLNDRGRPVRDYHLSKAQCWLDVSFHEYTRNDRSAFTQEALTESEKLIIGMETGVSPLPMDTPLVNGAARLRPDLWDRAFALRKHAGWACAQAKASCAEVELVHAGNEINQQQWRHAKPYVQIAEDLLGEAQSLAEGCLPPPPPPPVVVPVPVPRAAPMPPVRERQLELAAHVLFNFDGYRANDIRPYSNAQVENLVKRIQREKLDVVSVKLTGHADRLNRTGQSDYNQRLSERRVQTVREMLVRLGLDAALISTMASGDSQQVESCELRFTRRVDLQECLLPNRRVEIVVELRGR